MSETNKMNPSLIRILERIGEEGITCSGSEMLDPGSRSRHFSRILNAVRKNMEKLGIPNKYGELTQEIEFLRIQGGILAKMADVIEGRIKEAEDQSASTNTLHGFTTLNFEGIPPGSVPIVPIVLDAIDAIIQYLPNEVDIRMELLNWGESGEYRKEALRKVWDYLNPFKKDWLLNECTNTRTPCEIYKKMSFEEQIKIRKAKKRDIDQHLDDRKKSKATELSVGEFMALWEKTTEFGQQKVLARFAPTQGLEPEVAKKVESIKNAQRQPK